MVENVQRLAAFSKGPTGGNPAGVWLGEHMPQPAQMQRLAAQIGHSETVFAVPSKGAWRTRYFAPEKEIAFCGHATIALGHALSKHTGKQRFILELNDATISVAVERVNGETIVVLQSPQTWADDVPGDELAAGLELFGLKSSDLHETLRPAVGGAGERHLYLPLRDRQKLAAMSYDFDLGQQLLRQWEWVTVDLFVPEHEQLFHARVAFAGGGVVEDPATGAAAAGLAEVLRFQAWPHGGQFQVHQGDDMGMPSRLTVNLSDQARSSVSVSGMVREL